MNHCRGEALQVFRAYNGMTSMALRCGNSAAAGYGPADHRHQPSALANRQIEKNRIGQLGDLLRPEHMVE